MEIKNYLTKWAKLNKKMMFDFPPDDNNRQEFNSIREELSVRGIDSLLVQEMADNYCVLSYKDHGLLKKIKINLGGSDETF